MVCGVEEVSGQCSKCGGVQCWCKLIADDEDPFNDLGWTRQRLHNLASNLSVAAGLCEAFDLGYEQHSHEQLYSNHGYRKDQDWSPGCGRQAP